FRCAALARTMQGVDLSTVLKTALEHANREPAICPFCANTVFPGILQGRCHNAGSQQPAGPGLRFRGTDPDCAEKPSLPRRLFRKVRGGKSWWLAGGHVKARSCGKCRRLFLWGLAVDDTFVQQWCAQAGERFCPHCGDTLWIGEIALKPNDDEG